MTLGRSHVLLESHQPNENGSDDTQSVCFPGLLWDPIRGNLGTGKLSGKMNVLFRQEVMQVEWQSRLLPINPALPLLLLLLQYGMLEDGPIANSRARTWPADCTGTCCAKGTRVHFYVSIPDRQIILLWNKEAFLGKMGQMLRPPYPLKQHLNGWSFVPFEVWMIPSNFVTVYSLGRVAEFSSHPLQPWQKQFPKMPE